ncbi:hypothetical protein [Streptomyces rochei]|uniref:hypothetical protein n=1 Tax=Streptomyces rochei TaxID=1928 RepID=UPI003686056C
MRESYDEYGAASRLKVTVAAWRWAVASGLVPAADAGAGRWFWRWTPKRYGLLCGGRPPRSGPRSG